MASKPEQVSALPRDKARKGLVVTGAVAMILAAVYSHEGAYSNDRADRGGPTMDGVTQAVARAHGYRGDMRDFPKHCDSAHPVCADSIYIEDYMATNGALDVIAVSPAIGDELVDTAVNMGPRTPLPWFREGLNALGGTHLPVDHDPLVADDLGALVALRAKRGGLWTCIAMLDYLDARQRERYEAIVRADPSQQRYLAGWLRWRIGNVDRRDCAKEVA